ncbi:MAG: winged helix-turn-helix domain-containing protein [Actinomycetes bacterium]
MTEPRLVDDGIRFSAVLYAGSGLAAIPRLGATQLQIMELISEAPRPVGDLLPLLAVGEKAIQRAVRELVRKGLAVQEGGRGRPTVYRAASGSAV